MIEAIKVKPRGAIKRLFGQEAGGYELGGRLYGKLILGLERGVCGIK